MEVTRHPFSPTPIFLGFFASTLYGAIGSAVSGISGDSSDMLRFAEAYFVTYNGAIAGGFVLAAAFTVHHTQYYVSDIIERTFQEAHLETTDYSSHRRRFFSARRGWEFSGLFAVPAFCIFAAGDFGLAGFPDYLMIMAGCLQYALGVYVGRKIFYITRMLQAIEHVHVERDIFTDDELGGISSYVNYLSTLTAATVYIGVMSYYKARFPDSDWLELLRVAMLLPAIIAVPVLLFAYSPRVVIRRLYEKAIELVLVDIREQAETDSISGFESSARILELRG